MYSCSECFSLCIILSSHLCTVGSKSFSLCIILSSHLCTVGEKASPLCIILSSHLCTVGVKASPSVLFSLLTFVQLRESFSLCIILSSHLCTVGVKASPSVLFSLLIFVQLEWKLLPLYYSLFSPLYSWSESFSHCIIISSHLCTVGVKASPSVLFSLLTFVQLEWKLLPLYYSLFSPLYSWSKSFSLCIILSSHLCTVGVKASPSVLFSLLTFVQLEWKLLPLYYYLLSPLYSWSESFSLCIILSLTFVQL